MMMIVVVVVVRLLSSATERGDSTAHPNPARCEGWRLKNDVGGVGACCESINKAQRSVKHQVVLGASGRVVTFGVTHFPPPHTLLPHHTNHATHPPTFEHSHNIFCTPPSSRPRGTAYGSLPKHTSGSHSRHTHAHKPNTKCIVLTPYIYHHHKHVPIKSTNKPDTKREHQGEESSVCCS